MGRYTYTSTAQLRKAFKEYMTDCYGDKYWKSLSNCDKRCMFLDWTDALAKDGEISWRLCNNAYWSQ